MDAEEYLGQIKQLEYSIERREEEIEHFRDIAEYKWIDYKNFHVKEKSAINDSMAETVTLIAGLEKDLQMEYIELLNKRREIIKAIEQIKNPDACSVIYNYYVKGITFQSIADMKDRSIRWVYTQRNKGLEIIQSLLDCGALCSH